MELLQAGIEILVETHGLTKVRIVNIHSAHSAAIIGQGGLLAAKTASLIIDLPDELLMHIISFLDLPTEHDS